MHNKKNLTISQIIQVLVLLLALWLRFINLGKMPLSDMEATPVISALNISQGQLSQSGNQPLYSSLTSILFELFNSNNFVARFIPALAGSVMILTISLFFPMLNRFEIFLFSLLLIIDPVFLSLSRQVDSRVLVITLLLSSFGFLYKRKYSFAGISSALLVLSGVYFWHVVFIFLIFLLFSNLANKICRKNGSDSSIGISIEQEGWKEYFSVFLVSLLLIGTRFLSTPLLLEQAIQSFLDYFAGWANINRSFSQASLMITVFFLTYPLFILFGLIGSILMIVERKRSMYLVMPLFLIALMVTLAYPEAKQVDIVFIIPFLIYFFMEFLIKVLPKLNSHIKTSLLVAIPVVFMAVILGLSIINTVNVTLGIYEIEKILFLIIGCIFLVGIIFVLVSWGWSYIYALNGLTIGLVLILGIFHLSMGLHVLALSPTPEAEIWWLDSYFKDADLVLNTIEKISTTNSGLKNRMDVVIENSSLPSVNWLLREYDIKYLKKISTNSLPSIIITKKEPSPLLLNEEYRGLMFIFHASPYWIKNLDNNLLPMDFYKWLFFRKNAIENEEYYLWAQTDLFPGNNIKFENIN